MGRHRNRAGTEEEEGELVGTSTMHSRQGREQKRERGRERGREQGQQQKQQQGWAGEQRRIVTCVWSVRVECVPGLLASQLLLVALHGERKERSRSTRAEMAGC